MIRSALLSELDTADDGDEGLAEAPGQFVMLDRPCQEELAELEAVVSGAVLVSTAFRLRDEQGLIATLRRLVEAVARLEEVRTAD